MTKNKPIYREVNCDDPKQERDDYYRVDVDDNCMRCHYYGGLTEIDMVREKIPGIICKYEEEEE